MRKHDESSRRKLRRNIFIGIAAFWLVIVITFIAVNEYTLRTGDEVLLRTAPVDPRDLFRGDYVNLRYEISTVPSSLVEGSVEEYGYGDRVYVLLEPDGEYMVASSVSRERPASGLYMSGVASGNWRDLNVVYGIETYFVPEGTGRAIERNRNENVSVLVAVDDWGRSRIKTVFIDGEPFNPSAMQ